ncbi:MAG: lipid II flippase MurJ [Planctomycetota bacterium]
MSVSVAKTSGGVRQAVAVGSLAATTVGLSFVAQVVLVLWLGSGYETDAFFAAAVVPQVLFDLLVGSLALALTPLLVAAPAERRRRDAWTLVWAVGLLFAGVAGLLAATVSVWSGWLLPGMTRVELQLVEGLMRVSVVGAVFLAMSTVAGAALKASERFAAAERATATAAVAGLLVLLTTLPWLGVVAAPLAWVIRMATELALVTVALKGPVRPDLRSPVLPAAARKAWPLIAGSFVFRTDLLFDRLLSSMAPTGGLTLLALGRQLHHAAARLIGKALVATVGPRLTVLWGEARTDEFFAAYRKRRRLTLAAAAGAFLCVLTAAAVSAWLAPESQFAGALVLLVALGGILLFEPLAQLGGVTHFARGDTATPARYAAITFVASVGLRLIGFYWLGLVGVALGASAYFVLQAAWLNRSVFTRTGSALYQADPSTTAPPPSRRQAA